MTLYRIKLACITLILFIAGSGCKEKDELTLPVRVYFKIGISPENATSTSYLKFTGGQIGVQGIRFEGKREAGEDIFFETDPKMNLQKFAFSTSEQTLISDFDIPQGIFNYMKWDIILKKIETEGYIDNDDTDPLSIGIVISGIYEYPDGQSSIPVIIAIDDTEQFSVKSDDPEGNSRIILSSNKEYYEAVLLLAPVYAFSSISRGSLEEADISGDPGHQVIVISRNENEVLYENLLYRIALSARILIR